MSAGTVQEIWRYPVKSMGGETIPRATIGSMGMPGDRGWALRDSAADQTTNAKRTPGLLLCSARYLAEPSDGAVPAVEIELPGGERVRSDDAGASARISAAVGREVTLSALRPPEDLEYYRSRPAAGGGDPLAGLRAVLGLEADEPIPDFSIMPKELRGFATLPGTHFDAFPVHLLTTASLAELSARKGGLPADRRRFRANLVIETPAGVSGFPEMDWCGKTLRVGSARLRVEIPTIRCAMPGHPQPGLEADRAVTRTLVREANHSLGVYLSVLEPGTVAVGDPVEIEA
jgi:hypothetical protein